MDSQYSGTSLTHWDYLAEDRRRHAASRERFIHKASVIATQESTALRALDSELNFAAAVASLIIPASPTGLEDSSRSIHDPLTDFLLQQAPGLES